MTTDTPTTDARDLSCQGLMDVLADGGPDGGPDDGPTFHGLPVVHYAEEMARRGEWHVCGCELIGHGWRTTEDETSGKGRPAARYFAC